MGGEVIRAGRLTGGMDESRGRQKQLLAELEQHPAPTMIINRNKTLRPDVGFTYTYMLSSRGVFDHSCENPIAL